MMLIFPFNTTTVERCFSHINQIKTSFRNALSSAVLEDLLFIVLSKNKKEYDLDTLAKHVVKLFPNFH